MARTKQPKTVRFANSSQRKNADSPKWDSYATQPANETFERRQSVWDARSNLSDSNMSQQSEVNLFSQVPQVGSQLFIQDVNNSRENYLNSTPKISRKREAFIDDETPRVQRRKIKKKFKPGAKALKEIAKYRKSTNNLIKRAPFVRVVKEILQEASGREDLQIQTVAVNALQEATEAFIVTLFEAANLCAHHGKRVTVMPRDFELVREVLALFGGDSCLR